MCTFKCDRDRDCPGGTACEGWPAVVSVKDATRRIRDGQLIEIDGTTGTVRIVTE